MGVVKKFPSRESMLPPGGGPLFVMFLAQHSACVRSMDSLRAGRIKSKGFGEEYLRQLERFWSLDETALRRFMTGEPSIDEDMWDDFCTARTLFNMTNSGVLLDRDTRP